MAKASVAEIRRAILRTVPKDGSSVGNLRLREQIAEALQTKVNEEDYFAAREELIAEGKLAKGQGRGGSVRRIVDEAPALTLAAQDVPAAAKAAKPKQTGIAFAQRKPGEPTRPARRGDDGARIIAYQHEVKRLNNPDVGVMTLRIESRRPSLP